MELAAAREESSKVKQENLAWRKKAVLYKMRLASAEETVQMVQSNLEVNTGVVKGLIEEREQLLLDKQTLRAQVEALAAMVQGKHRETVAQKVSLGGRAGSRAESGYDRCAWARLSATA